MLIPRRKIIPEKSNSCSADNEIPHTHNVPSCLITLPCSQDPIAVPYSEPDHSSSMPAILSISLNFTSCIPCGYNNLQSATTFNSVCKLNCPWHSHCAIKLYFSTIHFKNFPPSYTNIPLNTLSLCQMLYWYNWLSWWCAQGCLKHVENQNKYIQKELCVKLDIYWNCAEMHSHQNIKKGQFLLLLCGATAL
jgi:hypothetical protein